MSAVKRYPLAIASSAWERRMANWANSRTAVIPSLTNIAATYIGTKASMRASGTVDSGPAATTNAAISASTRSEEHTSELQSPCNLVCRLLLEKKKNHPAHELFATKIVPSASTCPPSTAPLNRSVYRLMGSLLKSLLKDHEVVADSRSRLRPAA